MRCEEGVRRDPEVMLRVLFSRRVRLLFRRAYTECFFCSYHDYSHLHLITIREIFLFSLMLITQYKMMH